MITTALYFIQSKIEALTGYDTYIEMTEDDSLPKQFIMITQTRNNVIDAQGSAVQMEFELDVYAESILTIDTVFDSIMAQNEGEQTYTKDADTIRVNEFFNLTGFSRMGISMINDRKYVVYRIEFYIDYSNI